MKFGRILAITGILFTLFWASCSNNKNFAVSQLQINQAVKIIFKDGSSDHVFIIKKDDDKIIYVSEADHKTYVTTIGDIRRIEKINKTYDYLAYPISKAEIEKYKGTRNTWGYALGGAIIGGAAGLLIGLPFWYADIGGVPPFFVAGAGAVAGSIFFAIRGQEKDREVAINKIQYLRSAETDLEKQLEKEKKKLKDIENEKQRLRKKLKDKKYN